MDGVLAAKRNLATLEQQRRSALGKKEHLAEQREALAFDALTGGAGAKKQLDAMTADAARVDLEIENIASAITEAKRRVALAEDEAEREAVRASAAKARELVPQLRQAGHDAQAAVEAFVIALGGFFTTAREIHALGVGGPSVDLVRVNLIKHLQAILARQGVSFQPIPGPTERRTTAELVDHWTRNIEAQIARQLGEPVTEAA